MTHTCTFPLWFKSFLINSGVKAHHTLIVHSAIRELSRLGIRAQNICDVLKNEVIPSGNLLMPTMTWRTVTPKSPIFNSNLTPSHTGALTEYFRKNIAQARSLHPTHSVAGTGPDAKWLLNSHDKIGTPCSKYSPYGLITDSELLSNTFVLLIQVGLESCTFIHHFEELVDLDIYLKPEIEAEKFQIITSEQHKKFSLRAHNKRTRDFHQFGPALFQQGALFIKHYHGITFTLIKAENIANTLTKAFNQSQYATLASFSYLRSV